MGLKGKLTGEVEVSSHGHHVHELFAKRPHNISQISSTHIQACEIHEDEYGKEGSILNWNYTIDGKECVEKTKVVKLEETETEKKVSFKALGGSITDEYENYVAHLCVTEKEVKWVLVYERRSEDVPHLTKVLDMLINVSNNIDDHHLKA